jgi:uncharacterized protein (DUF2235 family)
MAIRKKLVLCCDGTWNWPDQGNPTNVVRTARALLTEDREGNPQIVFYDQGVGSTGRKPTRVIDGAFGIGLSQNVLDAYRFLADNYREGDELFFFGFSRGAYTVRSLAGFMGMIGLLHKGDLHLLPEAYGIYRMTRRNDAEKAARAGALDAFKKKLSDRAREQGYGSDRRRFPLIHFLGVWDTVGSLGIPAGDLPLIGGIWPNFHDTELNCFVRNAYQALAIDEHRKTFEPAVWVKRTEATPPPDGRPWVPPEKQNVVQRWFRGAHSNVGGGYPEEGLANIAWRWMLDAAASHGLAFDDDYIRQRIRPDASVKLTGSRHGFWKLWPAYFRKLCETSLDTEALHPSVCSTPGEPAKNLTELFASDRNRTCQDWTVPPSEPQGRRTRPAAPVDRRSAVNAGD